MEQRGVKVYSEIGKLKTVLLHKPGREIENLTPSYLENLLFDDIPYLKIAREEHDKFAEVFKMNGIEVLYLENLVTDSIKDLNIKEQFVEDILLKSNLVDNKIKEELKKYLLNMLPKEMIDVIMAGVRKEDILLKESKSEYPFLLEPMPNLYFTRDPFACIGSGVSLNSMRKVARRRETLFGKYIFKYHPWFKDTNVSIYYDMDNPSCIEGGDQLVLSKEVLAIGCSERTDKEAVLKLASNIFKSGETFEKILLFNIPKIRAFMHLDTVFTMVDYDKFTIHPEIEDTLKVIEISYDKANKNVITKECEESLESVLSRALKTEVTLIRCGGGDKIAAGREQWNDGSNTLAISPGKVITYDRNYVTNELLDKHNIEVYAIKSSELSRGRGGPRCMSMPFVREDI
ncbi:MULTISPECIES: arginine deiminase [Clostridium]|uniref:Arginine deiminase n=1 Tax=Clostridium senegalense TaxID=1465809 RepID=A0A6M0GZG1_9CLOT|nr:MULTISPECIES: arginine deiminase [Clostridium]NEU03986.1 arginine deiminase [Clostridium senegalense]